MQKNYSSFLIVMLLAHGLSGQTANPQSQTTSPEQPSAQPAAPQQTADTSNFTSAKRFVLEDATPVKLRTARSRPAMRRLGTRWTLKFFKISA